MGFNDNYGNGMFMPVAPMYSGGYGNGGYGNSWGGDGAWWLLVLLFALGGNRWGNGFGGGGDSNAFPWLVASNANSDNLVQAGFNQAATAGALSGIQNSITTGFSNAEVSNCNREINTLQTAYNNQIASMNQNFAAQTAIDSRLDNLASDLQKCCCDNELRTEQLRFTVATENAADREALSNGVRDILTNQNAGIQRIVDKLCDQELQAERRENAELRSRINMLDLAASQAQQTAALVADNTAQTQALIQRIAPYPQPAYVVGNPYGCNNYSWGGYGNGFGWGNGFNNGFGAVGFGNGTF